MGWSTGRGHGGTAQGDTRAIVEPRPRSSMSPHVSPLNRDARRRTDAHPPRLLPVMMVGALVGAVMAGGAATATSHSAGAVTSEVVGCGLDNTATASDLQTLQQAIATLDAGPGPGTITLAKNCTYSFTTAYAGGPLASWYGPAALPAIASSITIVGQGSTIQRDIPIATPAFRLFYVGAAPTAAKTLNYTTPGAGKLTLQDLTLNNGLALGGDASMIAAGGGGAGWAVPSSTRDSSASIE